MHRVSSFFRRIWAWMARHPDDDPDAPKPEPFSSGRPHGQGGLGA